MLLLVGTLVLGWRRHAPLLVLGVATAAFFVYLALGYAPTPLPFGPLIALYTVAALCTAAVSATATTVTVAGFTVAGVTGMQPVTDDAFLAFVTSVVAAWILGYGVQLQRTSTSLLEQHVAQSEREQAAKTEAAIELVQTRIARELHDIVAHNVIVIVAQASAAQRVFDLNPELVRQALHSIEDTGRQALTEMRRLLGVLRPDQAQESYAPQPRLDQLPTLVEQIQRAGLPVELTIDGDRRPLAAGIELGAYRIIEEALTNILKRAGPTRAWVDLTYHTAFLHLQVRDQGQGSWDDVVAGQGLVGMRQRVALLGGDLLVGPVPGGGFQVNVTLPVTEEQQ